MVDVCKGASNIAPAECLDMLPQAVSSEDAIELCRTAQTVGPAVCAKARGQVKNGSAVTAGLCKGADGRGPADCFRRSELVMKMSADERVDLCNGAKSDAPARFDLPPACRGHQWNRLVGFGARLYPPARSRPGHAFYRLSSVGMM